MPYLYLHRDLFYKLCAKYSLIKLILTHKRCIWPQETPKHSFAALNLFGQGSISSSLHNNHTTAGIFLVKLINWHLLQSMQKSNSCLVLLITIYNALFCDLC